ncbi:MAG: FmdB family zinc ribbon protein [Acidobacteriota bacterium]
MPIYEYQCLVCGTRTEHLQKMSDPPLPACPKCGGEVKKLISSPAFQFKGSGWYATDYAGKSGAGKPESSSSEAKDAKSDAAKSEKSDGGSSSSSSSSESKPETKSEAKPEKKDTAPKVD